MPRPRDASASTRDEERSVLHLTLELAVSSPISLGDLFVDRSIAENCGARPTTCKREHHAHAVATSPRWMSSTMIRAPFLDAMRLQLMMSL